eukprot:CAMPEP_0202890622 /NCGR_PEP_ID=MMETSP1392-20130828/962_1 /ASSEMBLY_ACC=CAM_ASM_000868 /TAXON_ID=225041 /ORGANISM="Chlamydomonas chlamydogama, Strain SAG 11-48b" /LENGTH=316 /DNA_ID=CAMNT_0049574225 /DNA_START=325 /DNA_END=1275 /DNA_ORIENTATION=+
MGLLKRLFGATAMLQETMVTEPDLKPIAQRARSLARNVVSIYYNTSRVLFHHLHKSAGTTICHKVQQAMHRLVRCDGGGVVSAAKPGQSTPDAAFCNCNGILEGSGPFSKLSRDEQAQYLVNFSAASIFFNESPLGDDLYAGVDLVHVTVARHPFTRFLSHMMHILQDQYPSDYKFAKANINHVVRLYASNPSRFAHELLDNYMTRFYAGLSVFRLPILAITQDHLHAAVTNLKRFGAVFVLEDLPTADDLLSALMQVERAHEYHAGTAHSRLYDSLTDESVSTLSKLYKYDLMLYSLCKLWHARSVAAWELLMNL